MRLVATVMLACVTMLVSAAAGATTTGARGEAGDLAAIRAIGETWRKLYTEGRFAEIPDLYTEDTMVMPRGRPLITGRDGMRRAIGGLAAGRKVEIEVTEREAVVAGNFAWFVGDFRVTYTPRDGAAAPATEYGRSLILFRRDPDGLWRVHRDMDSPAPFPPADKIVVPPPASPPIWDPATRTEVTECDMLASSRYDRTRLAPPRSRAEIDVPAAIRQCEADLARLPGDPRIHFHLGRLYGYAGDRERTLTHRRAAAAAGNHNAMFLLAYLDWLAAEDDASRCTAAAGMRTAADRGNYSAQISYASLFLEGALKPCADTPARQAVTAYAREARKSVDGFFETRLADHLLHELTHP